MKCGTCKREHTGKLKTCDKCREYNRKYRQSHKADKSAYDKRYRLVNVVEIKEKKKQYYQDNKEWLDLKNRGWVKKNPIRAKLLRQRIDKRSKERHPQRIKARSHIGILVKRGDIPPANSLKCNDCGEQAAHYHHTEGYQIEKWSVVEPVCKKCHTIKH